MPPPHGLYTEPNNNQDQSTTKTSRQNKNSLSCILCQDLWIQFATIKTIKITKPLNNFLIWPPDHIGVTV